MIHQYRLNGYNIAYDVGSGQALLLDDVAYDTLSSFMETGGDFEMICRELGEKYATEACREAYDEIAALWGKVLNVDDDFSAYAANLGSSPIKAMCLNIAHDCNLRCEYCFAAQGDFGTGRRLMSAEVGRAAIDFLIKESGPRRRLEVDFFGGEPLMNLAVVKELVAYARGKEKEHGKIFRFTMTTNGLLLQDDNMEWINREMANVVLSIDGRREVNDRFRVTPGGQGSYDAILPKYQKLVSTRSAEYYVRGTYTKRNLDFTKDVLSLYDQGFSEISIEPVVGDSEKWLYALTEEDLPAIEAEYERLVDTILRMKRAGQPINFFHFMLDLEDGPCAIKRLRGCGCGNEYVAITPEGDIYPCHQFVGMDAWKMGNLAQGDFNREIKQKFSQTTIYQKESCRSCWARFLCSGGCAAANAQYEGDILRPRPLSCSIEKKRLECAIMLQAALKSGI